MFVPAFLLMKFTALFNGVNVVNPLGIVTPAFTVPASVSTVAELTLIETLAAGIVAVPGHTISPLSCTVV